jgi:hypothetical protein
VDDIASLSPRQAVFLVWVGLNEYKLGFLLSAEGWKPKKEIVACDSTPRRASKEYALDDPRFDDSIRRSECGCTGGRSRR